MRARKLILLLTILTLLLSACTQTPTQIPGDVSEPEDDPIVEPPPAQEGYTQADSLFALNYNPAASLNPFLTTNVYNEQLMGLLYEPLFSLDPSLEPYPVLCESWETEDGVTWNLTVKSGVTFHDGSALTCSDVVYSLIIAKGTAKYSARLEEIESIRQLEGMALQITMKKANYLLPALLDIPILKNGAADERTPLGTGPYKLGDGRLTAHTAHRDHTAETLSVIYLRDVGDEGLAQAFSERVVDLVAYDPTGLLGLNIHMVHETRSFDTTDLLYLGFNTNARVVSDFAVRRALMRLVNVDAICEEIFSNAVRKSPFVLNPALGLLEEGLEDAYGYSRQEFSRLCVSAGLEDVNSDGLLDYGGDPFTLRFIVSSDNTRKVAAARRVASDMRNMGVNVTLDVLSFEDYTAALESGNFSMYLGEVKLKADFDLTALLGGGSLNYGRIWDAGYRERIDAFLAAPDEEARRAAARELCLYAAEDAAIVPIAYKEYVVLSHVGVISGAAPSQSNIFAGAAGWKIKV